MPMTVPNLASEVDVSMLDEGHVIPNMEPPVWRGVWFTRGYSQVDCASAREYHPKTE
jgi:hypothetical protein